MATMLHPTVLDRGKDKRLSILRGSKTTLFSKTKPSDEWHQQIDFTAGILRPSDKRFPYLLLKKHTDAYLNKKGRITQQDTDIRLAILIESHEAKEFAIAACAHAMSPASIRALINVELDVAPASFYGLEMFLQSLIAANYCNPKSISDLEAHWAFRLLPYASHGAGAAGRYLEGMCSALATSKVMNLNILPDFSMLARRAFGDFALHLDGLKLRCMWVTAHSSTMWLSTLSQDMSPVTLPGHILPEYLLDVQFPTWRIWASWKPNLGRIALLDGLDGAKRSVLPDLLALEGPDFITGTHGSLREGLVAQYGAVKSLVRFRGIIIEVPSCTKDELKETLNQVAQIMEIAVRGGEEIFKLFAQLTIARPITLETLQLLEAVSKVPDAPRFHIHNHILELYLARPDIGGQHISALQHLVYALTDAHSVSLQKVLLQPWLTRGIEKCISECHTAFKTQMENGLVWTHLVQEFYNFCRTVKSSECVLSLLDMDLQAKLQELPSTEVLGYVVEIYDANGKLGVRSEVRNLMEAFCIDQFLDTEMFFPVADVLVEIWKGTKSIERRNLAMVVCNSAIIKSDRDFWQTCRILAQITELPDQFITEVLAIMSEEEKDKGEICVQLTRLLVNPDHLVSVKDWKSILYNMIDKHSATILDYTLTHLKSLEWSQWIYDLYTVFTDIITTHEASSPPILHPSLHLWVQQLSPYMPALIRLEEAQCFDDSRKSLHCLLKGGEGLRAEYLVVILKALVEAQDQPVERILQIITGRLKRGNKNAYKVSNCVQLLLATSAQGLEFCQRISHTIDHAANEGCVTPPAVTEVRIAGWVQDDEILETDKAAIRALALLLGLKTYEDSVPKEKLEAALQYYEEQEKKVLAEADRLESIQKVLRFRDLIQNASLSWQLRTQDSSLLDKELATLSPGIIDAVEIHSDNEVEISFPLGLTDFQRGSMGIGDAKTLLVRLFNDDIGSMPPAFCVHLDTDPDPEINDTFSEHTPWICQAEYIEPYTASCRTRLTPLTFVVYRNIYRYICSQGPDILGLYAFVKRSIDSMSNNCWICDSPQCLDNNACVGIWERTPPSVQISQLWSDPFAVDLLLTGVYVAAVSERKELLLGCPISSTAVVASILNSLPSLDVMKAATDLSSTLAACHRDAEKLLIWACTHYHGFMTSAIGAYKIPDLACGIHQFVLSSIHPDLVARFSNRLPKQNPSTRILFHGTTLDRLPSILAQGLRVLSFTPLGQIGASYGKGIYLAEEPVTSLYYSPTAISWRMSGFHNMRLLLGCELIGNGNMKAKGIHVIKDQRDVILRYVFLLPGGVQLPSANHLLEHMRSGIQAFCLPAS